MKQHHQHRQQREQELLRLLRQTEAYKKQVRTIVADISDQYKRNIISHAQYQAKIKHAFGQHTPLALLRHYDQCAKHYQRELRSLQHQEQTTNMHRSSVFVLVSILLLTGAFFFMKPFFTGFFSVSELEQEETVDLLTQQDMTYTFTIPAGELRSLAISGVLEGDGEAQVYLNDENHLIYDSTQPLVEKKGLLTKLSGLLTAPFTETPSFVVDAEDQEIPSTISVENMTTTITPSLDEINTLEFENLQGSALSISTTVRGVVEPNNVRFTKVYALDTSEITFTAGQLTATATGTLLYNCSIFDYSLGICLSSWSPLKNIGENQPYTVNFEPGILALAEGILLNATNQTQQTVFPLEAIDIAVANFQLGDVAKFDILLENVGAIPVTLAHAHMTLFDQKNITVAEIESFNISLAESSVGTLKAYWDSADMQPGLYSGVLTLIADGQLQQRALRIQITPKKLTTTILDVTGMAVTPLLPALEEPLRTLFSAACVDTCALEGFNASEYTLLIRVKDAFLNITSLRYTLSSSDMLNPTTLQPLYVTEEGEILVDKTKITYRDETPQQHKLQQYREDQKKDHGKNWDRTCQGDQCTHVLYSADTYFEKEDGSLTLMENALETKDCRVGEEVCVAAKDHYVGFKEKATDVDTITLTKENYTLSFAPLQLRFATTEGQSILSSVNPVTGKGQDNTYTYENIFGKGIDLQLTYTGDKIKEDVIFRDNHFLQSLNNTNETGIISLDYIFDKPSDLRWSVDGALLEDITANTSLTLAQGITLENALSDIIAFLPQPTVTSAEQTTDLTYALSRHGDQEIISIQIPISYLQTATYPITIDPTVLFGDTQNFFDGFVRQFPKTGDNTRSSTATTLSLGDTNLSANCVPGSNNICHERITLMWDVSSIPDNAQIIHLNLTLNIQRIGNPDTTIMFYHMDGNSTTYPDTIAGNRHFFIDMGNGTNYYNKTIVAGDLGLINYTNFTLADSTPLLNDLHTFLRSGYNMWTLGMKSNETNSTATIDFVITSEEGAAANRPRMTIVYNLPAPEITLNAPVNNSRFAEFINITLNATLLDNEPTIREVVFYGGNTQPPLAQDILALFQNVTNGTVLQYNWTAPVQRNDVNTVLLLHFDNRSEFGENTTKVVDFSNNSNNGTIVGAGITNILFNATGGKLGGAFRFNSSTTGNNRNITLGDQDELIGLDFTYLMWVHPTNISKNATLLNKYLISTAEGLSIALGSNGDLIITTDATITRSASFFPEGAYTHLGITLSSTNDLIVYKNGVSAFGPVSVAGVSTNNVPFDLAIETNPNDASFVGYLDEVVVLNKTLTAAEIVDRYRLRGDTYFWFLNASDASNPPNGTNTSVMQMFTISMKPNVTQVSLSPSPVGNTTDKINCTFTVIDVNTGETLTANVSFYNNSAFQTSVLVTVTNGTSASSVLGGEEGVTGARNETWKCGVTPFDGIQNGDQKNSSTITLVNSPPSLPVLVGPPVYFTTTNVNPELNWTASTDPDNDPINYTVNITCFSTSGGGCTAPGDNRLFNVTTNNTAVSNNLRFRVDDGFYYNWTVRATDGTNESVFTRTRSFNITVLVAISLGQDASTSLDLGTLSLGQTNDTSDDTPKPFNLTNQGNSFIDVNLTASGTDLFVRSVIPSIAFQFRIDNRSAPGGITGQIYNVTRSIIAYTNVPRTNLTAIAGFNYTVPASSALIDINVTVPLDEPSGGKGTTILLTGYYVGGLT